MATRRGGGPVHAVGHARGKMMQAGLGMRMVPGVVERSVPATRSRPTRLPPTPPMDRYEIEAGKRYRRHVARSLGGKTEARPPAPVTTRGIAAAYEAAERRRNERHVEGVAYRLGLR